MKKKKKHSENIFDIHILTRLALVLLIRTLDISVLHNNCNVAGEETSGQIGLQFPSYESVAQTKMSTVVHMGIQAFAKCVCKSYSSVYV